MAFENIELFHQIAADALNNYGWQETHATKLIVLSENATYLIYNKETGQKDGVLRIGRPGYRSISQLNCEMKWLEQINEYTPLRVANPIKGKDGKEIQIVKGLDGNEYSCVVSEFLSGEAPDENDEKQIVKHFCELGETTAYLHRQVKMWNGAAKLDRNVWNYETLLGDKAIFGRWRDFDELTPESEAVLYEASEIIRKRLGAYGQNSENFGLIHADLRLANLLIEGDQIKVIDFDDSGFGWYFFDIGSSLSFIEDKPIVPQLVEAWLRGYQKILQCKDRDIKEIDTFIMTRRIQLTGWMASHSESGPVIEMKAGWLDKTVELAKRFIRQQSI